MDAKSRLVSPPSCTPFPQLSLQSSQQVDETICIEDALLSVDHVPGAAAPEKSMDLSRKKQ